MPTHCPPSRARTSAPPARWRSPQTCDLHAPPWPTHSAPEAEAEATDCPTLDAFQADQAPMPAAPPPAPWPETEPMVTVGERHPFLGDDAPWGPLAPPEGAEMKDTAEEAPVRPAFVDGHVSEAPNGAFRGAGGRVGLNHLDRGTTVSGFTAGFEFGWGGDRGLYGRRGDATMGGARHDPARARESGFWGGLNAFDAGFDVQHDAATGAGEWSYRADAVNGAVGARAVNEKSESDRGLRIGAGLGVRAAGLRWYDQDADEDGRREFGLGLSTPAFGLGASLDYTTETPIGDLFSLLCPISLPIQAGMVALGAEGDTPAMHLQREAESLWHSRASAPGPRPPQP